MIVFTERLKKFIDLFPNRGIFCDKIGYSEPELSKIINEKRDVPRNMIEALHKYTGWELNDLIEVES